MSVFKNILLLLIIVLSQVFQNWVIMEGEKKESLIHVFFPYFPLIFSLQKTPLCEEYFELFLHATKPKQLS